MRYLPFLLICLGCVKPSLESEQRPKRLSTRELLDCPHVTTAVVAPAKSPKRQILHVLNWHFVDRKACEADGGEDWEAFLDSVERVQSEQVDLLRHLKDVHGVDAVSLDGMIDADVEDYRKLSGALARWKTPTGDDFIKSSGGETDGLCPFLGLNHSDAEAVPSGRSLFLARC